MTDGVVEEDSDGFTGTDEQSTPVEVEVEFETATTSAGESTETALTGTEE